MKYTQGMFERQRELLPLPKPGSHGDNKALRVLDDRPTAMGMTCMLTVNTEVVVVIVDKTQARSNHTEEEQHATCELLPTLSVPS